jgi:hypothetical protein
MPQDLRVGGIDSQGHDWEGLTARSIAWRPVPSNGEQLAPSRVVYALRPRGDYARLVAQVAEIRAAGNSHAASARYLAGMLVGWSLPSGVKFDDLLGADAAMLRTLEEIVRWDYHFMVDALARLDLRPERFP